MINFSARRMTLAAVSSAVLVVGALAASEPATAAPVTTVCSLFHAVTGDVPGDLVVPADNYCEVNNATVHGSVEVGTSASIQLANTRVDGNVSADTFADVTVASQASVGGDVVLDQASGFSADNAEIDGDVAGTTNAPAGGQEEGTVLRFEGATVDGDVSVSLGALYRYAVVDESTFAGKVTITGATVRFRSSTVYGHAILDDARTDLTQDEDYGDPSDVCGVDFRGSLTLRNSPGAVRLGGGTLCPGVQPITVGGTLLVLDNTGTVHISARIDGDLVCRRNTHHPLDGHPTSAHLHTVVGGHALGQCVNLVTS